jgi:Tfp pilus assembly protein PilP
MLGQNRLGSNNISVDMSNNTNQPMYLALAQSKNRNTNKEQSNVSSNNNEETVVINVSNFGRSNPFKPYVEKSIILNQPSFQESFINVPKPPEYQPDPNFSTLFGIKVSGILYDAVKPSAIINVDNSDYLVHKGDYLFNFYVKDITYDKIAIKYRNNVYRAGIGEIIEVIVNINPVQRKPSIGYNKAQSSSSNIKLVNPVNLPSLPTLK